MLRAELKERIEDVLEALPAEKAEMVLDYAAYLKERATRGHETIPEVVSPDEEEDTGERELAEAEAYWFDLPEKTHRSYLGKTVAVQKGAILDSDSNLASLRRRVEERHADEVVLYIEADAEREPVLVLRSPRLK